MENQKIRFDEKGRETLEGDYVFSIYPQKTRNNQVYYHYYFKYAGSDKRYKGKYFRGSTGKQTIEEAKDKVLDIFYGIENWGITPKQAKKQKKVISFDTTARKFIKEKKDLMKQGIYTKGTIRNYEKQLSFIKEFCGKKDIEKIGLKDYNDYQLWRLSYYDKPENYTYRLEKYNKGHKNKANVSQRPFRVSQKTVANELIIFKAVLEYAYNNKLRDNKVDKLKERHKIPSYQKIKPIETEDWEKIRDFCYNYNYFYYLLFSFMKESCLRNNEIYNLKWNMIKWKKGIIEGLYRKHHPIMKMDVPLSIEARDLLEEKMEWDKKKGIYDKNEYVWRNSRGNRLKWMNKPFKRMLEKVGIEKNYTIYMLRHMGITEMLKRGIPIEAVAFAAGHTTTRMVLQVYSHMKAEDYTCIIDEHCSDKIENEVDEEKLEEMKATLRGMLEKLGG